jgi:hypothetical protein
MPKQPDSQRGIALALAKRECIYREGTGMLSRSICNCVYREAFRHCFRMFFKLEQEPKFLSRVDLTRDGPRGSRSTSDGLHNFNFSRPKRRVLRRLLSDDQAHAERRRVESFQAPLPGRRDMEMCCQQLKIDRGPFFHAVYRIQNKLGRAYIETSER